MEMKKMMAFGAAFAAVGFALAQAPLYKDASKSVDERVEDLLSRMTFEEKIGQIGQFLPAYQKGVESADSSKKRFSKDLLKRVRAGKIGSLIGAPGLENRTLVQKAALESRLGIPVIFGHDMIHGCTVTTPIPLAQSCAWDPDLWRRTAEMTALSARLKGCDWTFAPMMDIARDARWGRIAEGAGQDPYLCSLWSAAQVKGFQGDDVADGFHLAACAKHYVGYGAGEGGRDYDAVEMGEGTFRDIYLPPFASAVKAGVLTVMPAFHSFNGVPCAVNRWLLTDVLRGELGFDGFTISDWEAIAECDLAGHGVGDGPVELGAMALNAGMDMSMVDAYYEKGLKAALAEGRTTMKEIDQAVRRVLSVKMKIGLFERPFVDEAAVKAKVDLKRDLAVAREAAVKSCVLLKNEKSVLPLAKGVKVSLLGKLADDEEHMQGCWSSFYEVKENATLRQGLQAAGFAVSFDANYAVDSSADVVVAVFGEGAWESGEAHSRAYIGLKPDQLAAVNAIKASGKPFVAVLFSGRPLAVPELAEKADAVLAGWFLGSCAGEAIADVLSGAEVPSGRLTVDFPRTTGACPMYYNRLPTGRPSQPEGGMVNSYIDSDIHTPLYPFGFGLSYSEIAYSDESVAVTDDAVVFTATVANKGTRSAVETVQAYVRDLVGVVSRPKRELKGFEKVSLAPGESKKVVVSVPRERLVYHAGAKTLKAEGRMHGWIAPDSISGKRLEFVLK